MEFGFDPLQLMMRSNSVAEPTMVEQQSLPAWLLRKFALSGEKLAKVALLSTSKAHASGAMVHTALFTGTFGTQINLLVPQSITSLEALKEAYKAEKLLYTKWSDGKETISLRSQQTVAEESALDW